MYLPASSGRFLFSKAQSHILDSLSILGFIFQIQSQIWYGERLRIFGRNHIIILPLLCWGTQDINKNPPSESVHCQGYHYTLLVAKSSGILNDCSTPCILGSTHPMAFVPGSNRESSWQCLQLVFSECDPSNSIYAFCLSTLLNPVNLNNSWFLMVFG